MFFFTLCVCVNFGGGGGGKGIAKSIGSIHFSLSLFFPPVIVKCRYMSQEAPEGCRLAFLSSFCKSSCRLLGNMCTATRSTTPLPLQCLTSTSIVQVYRMPVTHTLDGPMQHWVCVCVCVSVCVCM